MISQEQPRKSLVKRYWWIGLIIILAVIGLVVLVKHWRINQKNKAFISGPTIPEAQNEPPSGDPAKSNFKPNSSGTGTNNIQDNTPAPTLALPYSNDSNPPNMMTPMGETLYHPDPPNPGGHPGIDFQWEHPGAIPTIIASMDGTVAAINDNTSHSGAFDIITTNGKWGVDYTELGSVKDGLKVGDKVKVGDTIGTPQHPSKNTDQPNFRMFHWQFGYTNGSAGVGERLCPMTYFSPSAKSTIESLWANTNSPTLKANAPDICSGKYK